MSTRKRRSPRRSGKENRLCWVRPRSACGTRIGGGFFAPGGELSRGAALSVASRCSFCIIPLHFGVARVCVGAAEGAKCARCTGMWSNYCSNVAGCAQVGVARVCVGAAEGAKCARCTGMWSNYCSNVAGCAQYGVQRVRLGPARGAKCARCTGMWSNYCSNVAGCAQVGVARVCVGPARGVKCARCTGMWSNYCSKVAGFAQDAPSHPAPTRHTTRPRRPPHRPPRTALQDFLRFEINLPKSGPYL